MLPLDELPVVPAMAAMRSSQTPVGWFEMRLPPGSPLALAAHSGLTYPVAPANGLSTWAGQLFVHGGGLVVVVVVVVVLGGGVVVVVVVVVGGGLVLVLVLVGGVGPLHVTPLSLNPLGATNDPVHRPL